MTITVTREVAEAEDWYQTNRIVEYYRKLKKMMEQDLNFDDVQEKFYSQNMTNNRFKTKIWAMRELGGHGIRDRGASTRLIFEIEYFSQTPVRATDDGYFGTMQLDVTARLEVDMPGKDRLPDSVLRRIWFNAIYRQQFRYWVEYAEEELLRFINETRSFLGLDPTVGKSRRLHFEPLNYAI